MTSGTQIHYYHLCKRKLWLFSNGVQMEQDSTLVAEGKFIHETTYGQRANKYKELDFGYVKIDLRDERDVAGNCATAKNLTDSKINVWDKCYGYQPDTCQE